MLPTAFPEPVPEPTRGFPFRRLLNDMGYASVLCLMIGLFIMVVVDDISVPSLLQHSVFALAIGGTAFLIIDSVRLALWSQPNWGKKQWIFFVGVMLAAAPVATYVGIWLASLVLGYPQPSANEIVAGNQTHNVVLTVFTTFGGMFVFFNRERTVRIEAEAARERARAESIARQAMQAQLQLLQAQVEPHMLFNTLANLQGLIALDAQRASQMLDQLIRYLRATLSSSRAEATTLAQEFDLLDAYLGLMAVRMGERLRFTLRLPDELRGAAMPPMLLQPLVENAIIHGLEPKIDGGELAVEAARSGDLLELTVRDTGLGLGAAGGTAGSGVGAANTRDRLRGLYGERASFALEPAQPHGTLARITLPLEMA